MKIDTVIIISYRLQPFATSTSLLHEGPLQHSSPSTSDVKNVTQSTVTSDETLWDATSDETLWDVTSDETQSDSTSDETLMDETSDAGHGVFKNLTATLFPEADRIDMIQHNANGLHGVTTISVLVAFCVFFFGLFMTRTFWWLKRRRENANDESRY